MEKTELPKTRVQMNWPLYLSDRETHSTIRSISAGLPGVLLVDIDGYVYFVDEKKLEDFIRNEEDRGEYTAIRELYDRAKSCSRNPYNSETDAVIIFDGSARFLDTLSDRRPIRAKAWWTRPGPRSVRHVNLEDSDDALLRFALGK